MELAETYDTQQGDLSKNFYSSSTNLIQADGVEKDDLAEYLRQGIQDPRTNECQAVTPTRWTISGREGGRTTGTQTSAAC